MSEEKKMIINEKDFVACNYFEACDYFKQLKRLEQENEELQYSLKIQCVTCKRALENCRILFIADKYKQALEEIRNTTETPIITDKNRFDEITNKIDEVLNENS